MQIGLWKVARSCTNCTKSHLKSYFWPPLAFKGLSQGKWQGPLTSKVAHNAFSKMTGSSNHPCGNRGFFNKEKMLSNGPGILNV